jgi:hypothetical protein
MSLQLTDADWAAIQAVLDAAFPGRELPVRSEAWDGDIYLAGLAAGLARAAKVCDTLPSVRSQDCAIAIRALLK